jgi:hypothetical protein
MYQYAALCARPVLYYALGDMLYVCRVICPAWYANQTTHYPRFLGVSRSALKVYDDNGEDCFDSTVQPETVAGHFCLTSIMTVSVS